MKRSYHIGKRSYNFVLSPSSSTSSSLDQICVHSFSLGNSSSGINQKQKCIDQPTHGNDFRVFLRPSVPPARPCTRQSLPCYPSSVPLTQTLCRRTAYTARPSRQAPPQSALQLPQLPQLLLLLLWRVRCQLHAVGKYQQKESSFAYGIS